MDSRIPSSNEFGQRNSAFSSGQLGSSSETELPTHSNASSSMHLDENLSRLFECMRLEYGTGGFLVSPKWKNFRSQKLQFAEKTRLNNAIWRCWHIQYLRGRRPLFCQFVPPLSEDKGPFQKKPLAVILEGRYWRRKLEAVAREYKKLRIYYKKWSGTSDASPLKHLSHKAQRLDQEIAYQLEERERRRRSSGSGTGLQCTSPTGLQCTSPTDVSSDTPIEQMLNMMDTSFNQNMALSSLADTLFTSRSMNLGGSVIPQELIQQQALLTRPADSQEVFQVPTLDSLQPNLDEFMEHFESFTSMIARQAENVSTQQQVVQQSSYQPQAPSVPTTDHSGLYDNQGVGVPFDTTVPGHEEVMDHSGVYESVPPAMFSSGAVDNTQLTVQQGMTAGEQVLMDISNDASAVADYSFNYANTMPGQSFTAQLEQPPIQSPLEEIQAQQLAGGGTALSPNQFVPNVDPFSSVRHLDSSSQHRKGRLPRNVSDSQLYTMDLSQIGTSFQTNLFPSMESNLPPQLQAPNLVAHLQSIPSRTRPISTPMGNQAKRAKLPRNMSDSRLSSLASMSKSPTSPPSLRPFSVGSQQLQPAVVVPACNASHQSGRLSAVKGRKSGRLPRNMSDSSLLTMDQQFQQQQVPSMSSLGSGLPLQRRRKMSDPQHVLSAAALGGNMQASSSTILPSHSSAPTFTNPTELYGTTSVSAQSVAPSQSQLLEQLLQSSLAGPTVNNSSPLNVVSTISAAQQASDPFQSARSSVLGQLLTQQTTASAATQQMQPRESNVLRSGTTQDPGLIKQLYQLQQVLQKQQPGVPSELVNALHSLSSNGAKHPSHQQHQQTQTAQSRTVPIQPSLQMKPKNQNAVSQALQALLQAPPNVTIQPPSQTSPNIQVNSMSSQSLFQVPVQSTQVPTVTIQHQPQNKQTTSTVNLNPNMGLPTAVIISPQGGFQASGISVQNTRTDHVNVAPLPETTNNLPQVVNIGQPTQRILLPASVNLSTLAQLGLSPASLQSVVAVSMPSTVVASASSPSTVTTMTLGAGGLSAAISSSGLVTESQDTGGMRPTQSLSTPVKPTRAVTALQRDQYKEHRRISHITAEQKRRGNIKMGFDQLMELVPSLANQRNSKVSKATVLQKTVDYTTKLQRERQNMQDEAEMLRKQIQELNTSISVCQQQLPATGVPVARQREDQMWGMFNQYVKTRTQDNFKFWIFSVLMRQLFEAFNNSVSTVSVEEFCQTVLAWLEQHCSLPALRPAALSSLRDLSKATSILSDPSKVPEQALRASISNDPTNLAAMMPHGGSSDGARNTGNSGGYPG